MRDHSVRAYVTGVKPGREVTLDVDAHLVESSEREAVPTYEGFRGYRPMLVVWAETGLVVADEFRDGEVPAGKDIARMVDQGYGALPDREGGWQVRVRSDSGAYDQGVLDHWDSRGWKFAVSADMRVQSWAEIDRLLTQERHLWGWRRGVASESGRKCRMCRAGVRRRKVPSLTGIWPCGFVLLRGCCSTIGRM